MTTTIYVSAGGQQYVGGTITETTGKDISLAACLIGLSDSPGIPPTIWQTPDVDTKGDTTASRVIKMLITSTVAAGLYFCWVKTVDVPEVLPMMVQGNILCI